MGKGGGGSGRGGSGGSGGASGGGGAAAVAEKPSVVETRPDRVPTLPDSVSVEKSNDYRGDLTDYSFKVGNDEVSMNYDNNRNGMREVTFSVGSTMFDKGGLSGREALKAVLTLTRIQQYDVSKAKDGIVYKTSAWTGDGNGSQRASAYLRMGFSPPKGNKAGGDQYGVVKDGKLVPSNANGKPIRVSATKNTRINRNTQFD